MTSPMMTKRSARSALAGVTMISLAVGLGGCISGGTGFAVLDQPAERRDALPADPPDSDDLIFDPASARYVADHDGVQLYLAKGIDSATCLLAYSGGPVPFVGCGGGSWFRIGDRSVTYEVRADGAPEPEDATVLSPNVYVIDH